MRAPMRARSTAIGVAASLTLLVSGCGDDDTDVITTIADATAQTGSVELDGFVVELDGVAKLCEALLESFPPQCGEPSVTIANIDELDATFATEQGVRWTDLSVRVVGTVDGGVVTIES